MRATYRNKRKHDLALSLILKNNHHPSSNLKTANGSQEESKTRRKRTGDFTPIERNVPTAGILGEIKMASALRILAELVEGATAESRAASKAALEVAAESAKSDEAATAIKTLARGVADSSKSESIGNAVRSMLRARTAGSLALDAARQQALEAQESLRLSALSSEEAASLTKLLTESGSRLPDATFEELTKVSEAEERDVMKLFENKDSIEAFKINNLSAKSITHAVEKAMTTEPRFAKFVQNLYAAGKLTAGISAAAYVTNWLVQYVSENSGPFVLSMVRSELNKGRDANNTILRKRIKNPYPCGFRNKQGEVNHPFDAVIRKHVRDPCSDWQDWDHCGGWTSFAPNGRITTTFPADDLHRASKLLNGAKLVCEDVSLKKAVVALVHEAGATVGGAVAAATSGLATGIGLKTHSLLLTVGFAGSIAVGVSCYSKLLAAGTLPRYAGILSCVCALVLCSVVLLLVKWKA